MFKTTKGLILREVRYKEADRILTVLTEDMGKMTVKARGALRKNSKTAASTQLLAFSELTLLERNGFWSVSEGSTIEEFKGLRGDITALSLASYFAECVEALSEEGNPDPLLLQLILNCLFALANGMYSQTHIKTAFEMRRSHRASARKTASSAAASAIMRRCRQTTSFVRPHCRHFAI